MDSRFHVSPEQPHTDTLPETDLPHPEEDRDISPPKPSLSLLRTRVQLTEIKLSSALSKASALRNALGEADMDLFKVRQRLMLKGLIRSPPLFSSH